MLSVTYPHSHNMEIIMHWHNIRHFILPVAQGLGMPLYVALGTAVYRGPFQAQYELWQAQNPAGAFALWMGVAVLLLVVPLSACFEAARRAPSTRRACWIVGCWLGASVMLGLQAYQEATVWVPAAGIAAMAVAYMALAVVTQREEWEAWRRQYLYPLDRVERRKLMGP
jgi:FtsH-binding integral membrane protein